MAEPLLIHIDEHVHHSKFSALLDGFALRPLPHANSAQNQAALDVSIGDAARKSTEGHADSEASYPSSCPPLPRKGCVSYYPCGFSEDPNAQSIAHVSCLAHSYSISEYTNEKLQADCAAFSDLVALSKGAQTHLTTLNEGFTYAQQFSFEPSTTVCAASGEESVYFMQKDQAASIEPYGHHENCTSPHIKDNDSHPPSREVCAGSAHVVSKFQNPTVQLSMASVSSCEASTSSHSTEPQGSYEDLKFSHAGRDDPCDDSESFTHVRRTKGDFANGHDVVQDLSKEMFDSFFQQADADATSNLQPCSSECSSGSSMATNDTSEVTSRVDNTYMGVDGTESRWTDAKHGSYLDYMETSFVKNLYGREYCALEVCGQQPLHHVSKNSSSRPSTLFEFKSWQSGDWHRRSMLKPPMLTIIPLALRHSPWVNHFQHRNFSRARHQMKIENVSTFCGVDGEEAVNSPSTELYRAVFGHDHSSRSNLGHEERLLCKSGSKGSEAVGVLKQDGLQEFAHDTEIPSFSNKKKRGIEPDNEQEPFIRCRRQRIL